MKPTHTAFSEDIIYFCKDCDKIVDAKQVGRKYVFRCNICGTKNVAFGTEKSINNFYHVEEKAKKAALEEKRKKAKEEKTEKKEG